MLKDTKSLGNNKAPACESRGFVLKNEGVLFDTPSNNIVHIQLRPLQVKKIPYHFHPKCNPLRSCDTGKYK